jgi:YHS domain-containing protein
MRPAAAIAFSVFALIGSAACDRTTESPSESTTQLRTIEQEHLQANTIGDATATDDPTGTSAGDGEVALPFEPPISMDPVDGSKVSIKRDTPSTEYGGKLYHFSSDENLKLFLADPKKYVTGSLATY